MILQNLVYLTTGAAIWMLARLFIGWRYIFLQRAKLRGLNISETDFPNLVIIVPALRERKVIRSTLAWMHAIKYPTQKLRTAVVTSDREYEHWDGQTATTVDIVRESLSDNATTQQVIHVHYPSSRGVKADQVNYAIQKLRADNKSFFGPRTYIGIYDADSWPDAKTLQLLARHSVLHSFPDIYQQPSLYIRNFGSLQNDLIGNLARCFSILQTFFSIAYEVYLYKSQAQVIGKRKCVFFRTRMQHCVGHGLFVRWPFLEKIGLFPTPIEDQRIGYIASYLQKKIEILPAFDACEVSEPIKVFLRQTAVWYKGALLFVRDRAVARSVRRIDRKIVIWISLHRAWRLTLWLSRGFFFPILWFLLLHLHSYALLIVSFLAVLWLPMVAMMWMLSYEQTFSDRNPLRVTAAQAMTLLLLAPIEYLLMSVGPLQGLLEKPRSLITKRTVLYPKTERDYIPNHVA